MSLVRFSYEDNPIDDLKKKVRHAYDLHQLLIQKEYLDFFHSNEFDLMLLKVANDYMASYRNNNSWLSLHPKEALIFTDLVNVWNALRVIYTSDFSNMVYGILPDENAVLGTLKMIQTRLESISWSIHTASNK